MPVRTLRAPRGSAPGLSGRTAELLQRADAELVAAQFSTEPWEQFTHAHLAALRAGAAVLADRKPMSGRRAPRTVWELLDGVARGRATSRPVPGCAPRWTRAGSTR